MQKPRGSDSILLPRANHNRRHHQLSAFDCV